MPRLHKRNMLQHVVLVARMLLARKQHVASSNMLLVARNKQLVAAQQVALV